MEAADSSETLVTMYITTGKILAFGYEPSQMSSSIGKQVAGVVQSIQCLAMDWMTGRFRFDFRQRQKRFVL
jgi:hypothetical protein